MTKVAVFLILALTLGACSYRPAQNVRDTISRTAALLGDDTRVIIRAGAAETELFRIETISCTVPEYLVCLAGLRHDYEGGLSDGLWEGDSGKNLADHVADNALAIMSRIKTMNLLAPEYEISLDETENVQVQTAAAEWYATLTDEDKKALNGLTEETAARMACEYALAQKLYAYIIRDLDPEISDDEARRVTVRYIKLSVAAGEDAASERSRLINRASMIRDEWLAGTGFDELAARYSDAGEDEWTFGRDEVDKAVEEAAYSLAEGEVSDPVATEDAVYLLYLISTGNREETRANKEIIADRRKLEVFGETYDTFAENRARHLDDDLYEALKSKNVSISAQPFYETLDKSKIIIN